VKTNETLREICDDIELLTGIKTVIYDEHCRQIHSQPNGMCAFCAEIRKSPALAQKCFACDARGLSECVRRRDIYVYHCHMGLGSTARMTRLLKTQVGMGAREIRAQNMEEGRKENGNSFA